LYLEFFLAGDPFSQAALVGEEGVVALAVGAVVAGSAAAVVVDEVAVEDGAPPEGGSPGAVLVPATCLAD
jgi:hypothetical protein